MPTDGGLQALREARPCNRPGFDEWLEGFDGLSDQISTTPVPARRRLSILDSRPRLLGISAAAAVLAAGAATVALTLTAASPPSAYAAATKALAATTATSSGTLTTTVSHDGSSYTLDTTQWNSGDIAVTRGQRSQFGPDQALVLIAGGAYVEQADGSWLHYANLSNLGPKFESVAQLAQNDVEGNSANQILSLATGLTQTAQPDGSTLYTGTIPNSDADPSIEPTDDTILRIIASLRSGNEPGGPEGLHDGIQLQMTVGPDGFVQQVSLTFQQRNTGTPSGDGTYTWTIGYSQLGSTSPIQTPTTSTDVPPGTTPTTTAPAATSTTTVPTTTEAVP